MKRSVKIPSLDDWSGYKDDLDASYAFKIFFGKSISEVIPLIHEHPIERAEELRFMPPAAFRYYIIAFRDYILSEKSREDSDAASCYLNLIEHKIVEEPKTINPVMPILVESVEKVAKTQSFYDAALDIYGDFKLISARIMAAYKKDQ